MMSVDAKLIEKFLNAKKGHRVASYFTLDELQSKLSQKECSFLDAQFKLLIAIYQYQLSCLAHLTHQTNLQPLMGKFLENKSEIDKTLDSIEISPFIHEYHQIQMQNCIASYWSMATFAMAFVGLMSMLFLHALIVSLILFASFMLAGLLSASYAHHQGQKARVYQHAIDAYEHRLHKNTAEKNQAMIEQYVNDYLVDIASQESTFSTPPMMGV
jgi:hypothetical protein